MTIKTVALIGAGNMGSRMAWCVHKAGYALTVCDQNQAVLDDFAKAGCRVTQSARDCAQADVVIVMVANDAQIASVTHGPEGIVSGLVSGNKPLICIMSTAMPDTVRKIAEALEPHGLSVVDAPVSGGLVKAAQGTLTIMMSGQDAEMDVLEPLMRSMGTEIFRCGALGAAEVVKVINNMLGIANIYLAAEAFQLASRYGVEFEKIIPILEVSSGRNFMTLDPKLTTEQYKAWARSPEAFRSLVDIVSKDLHLAQKLADHVDLTLPLLNDVSRHVDATTEEIMQQWNEVGDLNSRARP